MNKTKIIFVPTWRCNNYGKCPYCDYYTDDKQYMDRPYKFIAFGREKEVKREIPYQEWLEKLKPFAPYLLEMTGGEPMGYKEMPELLNNLPDGCKWAVTSNSLYKKVIERLPGHNCLAWTASYHNMNDKLFMDNLHILRAKKINVRVTLVFTPENWRTVLEKINWINDKNGFGVNLHAVLKRDFSWRADPEHSDIYDKMEFVAKKRGLNFIEDIPDHWRPDHFEDCVAGSQEYFFLGPDGEVFRCYSDFVNNRSLGYIEDFKPTSGKIKCGKDCLFPCDKNVATKGVPKW